jgi:hypothetical protein
MFVSGWVIFRKNSIKTEAGPVKEPRREVSSSRPSVGAASGAVLAAAFLRAAVAVADDYNITPEPL